MTNKLMLLTIIFALVLSLGVVIACGDDDDDDDDDDDATDDDDDDDDDVVTCDDAWSFFDGCGWYLEDEDGAAIDVADLIDWCDAGEAFYGDTGYECIVANMGDCDAVADCITAALE